MQFLLRPVSLALALALLAAAGAGAQQADIPVLPEAQPKPDQVEALPSQTIHGATEPGAEITAPLLTVDQDRLYANSTWGKRALAMLDNEGSKIAAENERLATQLSDEESRLTAQRATMDPAQFRQLAEAFDRRATQIRRERAQAVQDLNDWAESDRNAFYRAALPVMGEVMKSRGAVAVLDRRTVFVSLDAIDITTDLVTQLDGELGDGTGVVPFQPAVAPAPVEGAAPVPADPPLPAEN